MTAFPAPPASEGDTTSVGGVTFVWMIDTAGTGYWIKQGTTQLSTSVGDARVLYADGTEVAGHSKITIDNTVAGDYASLNLSASLYADTTFNLLNIIDENGDNYCSIRSNGLYVGEASDGEWYARKDGEWQQFSASSIANYVASADPSASANNDDIGMNTSPTRRSIHYYDGGWEQLLEIGLDESTVTANLPVRGAAADSGSSSYFYENGDLVIFADGSGHSELYVVGKDAVTGNDHTFQPIGGYLTLADKLGLTPVTDSEITVTGPSFDAGSLTALFKLVQGAVGLGDGRNFLEFEDPSNNNIFLMDSDGNSTWTDSSANVLASLTFTGSRDAMLLLDMHTSGSSDADDAAILIDISGDLASGTYQKALSIKTTSGEGTAAQELISGSATVMEILDFEDDPIWQVDADGRTTIQPKLDTNGSRSTSGLRVTASNMPDVGNADFELIRTTLPSGGSYSDSDYHLQCVLGTSVIAGFRHDGELIATASGFTSDSATKSNVNYQSSGTQSTTSASVAYSGLDKLDMLRVVSYTSNYDSTDRDRLGFIAQDVAKQIPEAVGTGDGGLKTLDPMALIATLVNAVQELSARVTELEA